MSAGIGIGAGLVSGLSPAQAESAAGGAEVWSQEYWAQKGDVKLYMFRKRREAPKAGAKPLPVLFLAHGSSMSSRPTWSTASMSRWRAMGAAPRAIRKIAGRAVSSVRSRAAQGTASPLRSFRVRAPGPPGPWRRGAGRG